MTSLIDSSPEEAAQIAIKTAAQDLALLANQFNPPVLYAILQALTPENDPHWKEKIWGIISSIQSRKRMEMAGKALSSEQILYLLSSGKGTIPLIANAIPALFVGLTHDTFLNFLMRAGEGHLITLQREAGTEPIQHHLIMMVHEMVPRLEHYIKTLLSLEQEILNITPPVSNERIAGIEQKIASAAKDAETNTLLLSRALGISWNTNREDLIDALGTCKENWQKFRLLAVGFPGDAERGPSGLYAALENQLGQVFFNNEETETLDDNTPAIDALIKFSIWYIQDYWEIGLLPTIKTEAALELDPKKHSEMECTAHRAVLFGQAKQNLEAAGLCHVKDLRSKKIFSKEALKAYLHSIYAE